MMYYSFIIIKISYIVHIYYSFMGTKFFQEFLN